MSKKSCFRGSFEKWHGKQTEKLLKWQRQHLYHIYWSLSKQFSCENYLLVIFKILALFVNPLTADASILFLIETIYSNILRSNYLRNEKYLLYFFVFPKFRFNSESFLKKYTPHSWSIFELTDWERGG